MSIEAMKQALEWIEAQQEPRMIGASNAIIALRKAIQQAEHAPAVEAVPFAVTAGYYAGHPVIKPLNDAMVVSDGIALYTNPPALDDETRKMVLELCTYLSITNIFCMLPFFERIESTVKTLQEKLGAE